MEDPRDRLTALQARIRDEHERLAPLDRRSPEFDTTATRVLDLADELVAFEARLPLLLDEPRRRLSLVLVRVAGAVAALTAGVPAVSAFRAGGLSGWWGVLLVPLAVVGVLVGVQRVKPVGGHHREQRTGACLAAAGTVAVVLVSLGVLPGWGLLPGAVLELAGLVLVFGGPARVLVATPLSGRTAVDEEDGA